MVTFDQHGAIYIPSNTAAPRPNSRPAERVSVPEAEVQKVDLASSRTKARPVTYSKPSGQATQPSAMVSDTLRELTPAGNSPKALIATKAFLDVAHFDGGVQLVDAYA